MNERIPRREAPDFRDSEDGLISSIVEDGFLNVALDDANQYGPHAMIVFLGFASVFGISYDRSTDLGRSLNPPSWSPADCEV